MVINSPNSTTLIAAPVPGAGQSGAFACCCFCCPKTLVHALSGGCAQLLRWVRYPMLATVCCSDAHQELPVCPRPSPNGHTLSFLVCFFVFCRRGRRQASRSRRRVHAPDFTPVPLPLLSPPCSVVRLPCFPPAEGVASQPADDAPAFMRRAWGVLLAAVLPLWRDPQLLSSHADKIVQVGAWASETEFTQSVEPWRLAALVAACTSLPADRAGKGRARVPRCAHSAHNVAAFILSGKRLLTPSGPPPQSLLFIAPPATRPSRPPPRPRAVCRLRAAQLHRKQRAAGGGAGGGGAAGRASRAARRRPHSGAANSGDGVQPGAGRGGAPAGEAGPTGQAVGGGAACRPACTRGAHTKAAGACRGREAPRFPSPALKLTASTLTDPSIGRFLLAERQPRRACHGVAVCQPRGRRRRRGRRRSGAHRGGRRGAGGDGRRVSERGWGAHGDAAGGEGAGAWRWRGVQASEANACLPAVFSMERACMGQEVGRDGWAGGAAGRVTGGLACPSA